MRIAILPASSGNSARITSAAKARQEAALEFGPRAVNADLVVGHRGQQQEAVVGNAPGRHVGLDDAGGGADRHVEIGAVGADDQRQVGRVQEVEAAAEADHPFAVFDVERAFVAANLRAHLLDAFEVAVQQRHQVGAHLRRHVGQQGGERSSSVARSLEVSVGQVELAAVGAVDDQRVLVGLEAADQRIDGAVPGAEDVLDLAADLVGVGDGRFGVVS